MDQYPKLDHRLNKELVKEAVLGNSLITESKTTSVSHSLLGDRLLVKNSSSVKELNIYICM